MEHAYFTREPKQVSITDRWNERHLMCRYYAETSEPRPESYREDVELVNGEHRCAQDTFRYVKYKYFIHTCVHFSVFFFFFGSNQSVCQWCSGRERRKQLT